MSRRLIFIALFAAACCTLRFADAAEPAKPNVLFIAVDDLNDWVGVAGTRPDVKTPNLDRLAARGTYFERAYCAAPTCQPSRVAVMTGLRPSTTGDYVNEQKLRKLLPDVVTLPQYFAGHGYRTAGGGKVFHHGDVDPQSWQEEFRQLKDPRPAETVRGPISDNFTWQPLDVDDSAMGDYRVVGWAAEQLARTDEKPFFLAVGFYRPHMPLEVPRKYFASHPLESIALPEVPTDDLADVPALGRWFAEGRKYHQKIVASGQWRHAVQAYLAAIEFFDAQLGRLLDALDRSPHRDNTIVVLWSDHGWHLGEKNHWSKFALWERATKVPLVVVAPGVTKPGTRTAVPVSLLDLYPTLIELCGLPRCESLEGVSLVPQLTDPKATRTEPAVMTFGPNNHAVRDARHRYIRYADGSQELYDHASDPNEWTNLATRPDSADAIRRLAEYLPKVNRPLTTPTSWLPPEPLAVAQATPDGEPTAANRPSTAARSFDVIVYGATPGGVCAAIGAAREGAKIALLEASPHIGGVNTGGLCFSDSNQTVRAALGGLFEEFHLKIEADYTARGVKLPYRVAEKDHTHWTYEPHVAARVFDAMLREAGVTVRADQFIRSIDRNGTRITGLTTTAGDVWTAKAFVDGSYEGDLLAASGVDWTIGREGRAEFDEKYAGKQYPKQPMPISGFDAQGKLLPLVTTSDVGDPVAGDRHVMTYSYRLCLTDQPENRVPFPKPAQYDPARFEVVRRYFAQEKKPILLWDLYPLPGGKFDANNGIGKQFSMGLVGGPDRWCEADAAERAVIAEAHKQYTLELYQFLTTDPAVPPPLRAKLASLGLCRDEFPTNGHWSPQLYVREGRRMRGVYVLTEHDVLGEKQHPDSIGVSSFPIDSHDCRREARANGTVVNEGTIFPVRVPGLRRGYAYQVPYRSITPKPEQCTNLLVPVALSATHVAYSSIRVEPTWMTLGHSSGIAAALCAKSGIDVQRLDYAKLRARLVARKQILEWKPDPAPATKSPTAR
jgi:arylsulfatase A-like enzyme